MAANDVLFFEFLNLTQVKRILSTRTQHIVNGDSGASHQKAPQADSRE